MVRYPFVAPVFSPISPSFLLAISSCVGVGCGLRRWGRGSCLRHCSTSLALMRQRQPLQWNNRQTGWQRLRENSESYVGVGGRANDIAHFHAACHGMKRGWKGRRCHGESRNCLTPSQAGEKLTKFISKNGQGGRCGGTHTLRIRDFQPLSTHPALFSLSPHCRPTSHSIHARNSKPKSICDMANIRNYIQIVAAKLFKGE